ncbi:MAG: substrate-binding domain-containing protein [Proteobacteria bacterium]|nr:substrate-binding domain-containing protein [Pseudomonadota bacterium]
MAELKFYCTIGVKAAVEALMPQIEQASGCRVAFAWGTAPMLVRRLQAGEAADLMVLNRAGLEAMTKEGRVVPGSQVKLAGSPVAIAVKAGAARPDISTPEALKQTLLNAASISYTDPAAGGASGVYFGKLLEKLGIAREVNAKNTFPPAGGFSATLLLDGRAELAIQQTPELLHVPGIEILGPLPGDLNMVTVFVGGVATGCADPAAATRALAFLSSPEAAAVFRAKGLDPDAP